jgi:hypothetical protein
VALVAWAMSGSSSSEQNVFLPLMLEFSACAAGLLTVGLALYNAGNREMERRRPMVGSTHVKELLERQRHRALERRGAGMTFLGIGFALVVTAAVAGSYIASDAGGHRDDDIAATLLAASLSLGGVTIAIGGSLLGTVARELRRTREGWLQLDPYKPAERVRPGLRAQFAPTFLPGGAGFAITGSF